ncbi:MAG: CCA-adding enzyme, partial [Parcubacteria group bacterium Gr01-1014_56]
MKNIKQLLAEVLEELQPDKKYEKEIFEKLNLIIKRINQNQKNIKAILGGSGAKGTWLKAFDADIFVLFKYNKFKDKSDKLSDILEKILKKKFKKIIRLHGSRDYFQINQNDFTF